MKRHNLPAILVAVLLFLLGAAVGALAHRYYSPTVVVANSPESFRQNFISEMRSKLALTPAQVKNLQGILDHTRSQVKAMRDRNHPEMVKIKEEQISHIRTILTKEQNADYDKLLAERERRNNEQEARERQEDQKREAAKSASQ